MNIYYLKKSIYILVILLTTIVCNTYAHDYIPLLGNEKEWGYIDYIPYANTFEHYTYFRLSCGNIKEIEGQEYYEICQYDSFIVPDNPSIVAYMREQDGKVFVRYPSDLERNDFNYFYNEFDMLPNKDEEVNIGLEHLIYDFNMEEGDSIELPPRYPADEYRITLKCIETGFIEADGINRKYLKFDRELTNGNKVWMSYEYIVEGIGPVGDCNFSLPYRSYQYTSYIRTFPNLRLLYQREKAKVSENSDNIELTQGKMLYMPPFFEIYGICDPSVYLWKSNQNQEVPSTENHKGTDVNIRYDSGGNIYCGDEPLKTVTEYNMIGQEIATHSPEDNRFKVSLDYRGKVVKVETENYCRYFTDDSWY